MANQPKKYKKFVATAATATLVASAIVPVASAAGFSDVAGNDHEVAINALADAGIINGYADGSFKPNQTINRGQVVKLLGRYLEAQGQEIPADWNSKQRFNDLPVTAEEELVKYAALAKDAGVFNGSNGNLNASQTMQRQQMAVVLVRAIKEIAGVDLVAEYKKANFVTEIGDLDKAYSAEQRTAIVALEYAGITNVAHFNPGNSVTRGQFASFLYRTIENVINNPEAGVAAVKAINNTTVEVTFDEEVDNVQALNFLISDLEVKNAAVKLTNKKVVVLTTAAQTADKEYTVSLGEEKIGTFKGIAAVVPTKVDLVEKSVQGKLGQQVTLKAQVTVAEGQTKAGIPVTFFIPGSANGVKTPVTVEAVTNEEGIATYSYTRYAATNDTVTVYANGDRSKFSTGYVFWAVDQTLEITEVTTGATINNGANKTYKVTYKHPETGKPVSGKVLNVSVKENIDVTVDKLQNVTVNGIAVVQTSDNNTRAAQVTTDSKGEATFTVSGSNAEVTPVVFEATPVQVTNTNGTVTTTGYTQKYTPDTLQASAAKVTFGAVQAAYTLEVTRDGGEVAATGVTNGRKYNLVVKDKDGKLAANETVNVAFNEDIDGVISTVTSAQFVKVENDKQVGYEGKKITVKTNSKGEASFVVSSDAVNTYATPIAWIDINNQSAKDANLDKGEPSAVAPISYFQAEYLDGSKLVSYKGTEETDKFAGGEVATFKVQLTNQSGKVVKNSGYTTKDVSYTVYNTGANNVKVGDAEIAPNRVHTVVAKDGEITVTTVDGKSSSVKVLATGVAKQTNGNKEFAFTSKEATATFTATKDVSNPYTGVVRAYDTDKKTISFAGKDPVKYTGETGKTYQYRGVGNTPIANATAFIAELKKYAQTGNAVTVTYEVKDDVVSFYIVSTATGTGPVDETVTTPAATHTGAITLTSTGTGNSTTTVDVSTNTDSLLVSLNDADLNVSKTAIDTATVALTDGTNAPLTLTLVETGVDTGIFTTTVQTGTLKSLAAGTLTVTYNDAKNVSGNAQTITKTIALKKAAGAITLGAFTQAIPVSDATAAEYSSKSIAADYTFATETFSLDIDTTGVKVINLNGKKGAQGLADAINAAFPGTATVSGDRVVIKSTTVGAASKIDITLSTVAEVLNASVAGKAAVGSGTAATQLFTITTAIAVGEKVVIDGVEYTAVAFGTTPTATTFVAESAAGTLDSVTNQATALATAITTNTADKFSATAAAGEITLTSTVAPTGTSITAPVITLK
ncbi:S-layer homology domain-containing protein [Lysinibacillus tabacifolii]|uniref:S-layer homology domain-containing protein n=6 Tax=Lysinibacillus TaxID=400634 RepID=A0ABY2SZQ6_9BACI|nr:S-layer homology domain-containing protein [Lysinibacillus tabacifolii]TKI48789.1 S-layer homology domain-containing protein [Lysinibacillus tabacifolii]